VKASALNHFTLILRAVRSAKRHAMEGVGHRRSPEQIKSDIASAAGKTRLGGADKFGSSETAPIAVIHFPYL
jgi:hypothetical protein